MLTRAEYESKKFGILSFIFSLIIGTYWLFRPVKDAVFFTTVGKFHQPKAKLLSILTVGIIVIIYSKLVDKFPRHKLLYGITLFYAIMTAVFAFFIWHPTIGIENNIASVDRSLGWLWYLFVESFGSIMVSLFWSFVSDTTTPDVAKRKYFTVAIGGQLGGFIAPLVAQKVNKNYGTGISLLIGVIALFVLVWFVAYYMRNISKYDKKYGLHVSRKTPLEGKPKAGFFEGVRLLFTRPYLFGIFTIVAFYEIVVTILDYHFKLLASTQYSGNALANYLYGYALWTNGVALACLIFGVGSVGRKLGLTRTLLLLPMLVACAVISFKLHPVLQIAFIIMVSCKGLNYALIQPSKEQLYIPTSKESKYKAKAWIDMFGSRSSKGMGAAINTWREVVSDEMFMMVTACLSMGMIAVWALAAYIISQIHARAIKEDRLVC
jgi:AAA family ATP:ADP antiporter